jgi:hypothetical protein
MVIGILNCLILCKTGDALACIFAKNFKAHLERSDGEMVGGDCDTNTAIVCRIVVSYWTSSCNLEDRRKAPERLPAQVQF